MKRQARAIARMGIQPGAARSLPENLMDQSRKLLRAMVVVDDVGLGKESLLVAPNADGSINQEKLSEVLTGTSIIIKEVADALEALSKAQDSSAGQAAR
jgi:hypothetical protein